MGLTNRIEIIDRDGWHREVTMEKSIVYIGSANHNDLYLDPQRGSNVSPTHAQMIFSGETAGCQLVNLAASDILIGGETRLAPEESVDLGVETMIQIGEFTLLFHGSIDSPGTGGQNAGRNLSLSVFLPANRLEAGRTITGTARVRNLGSESGVQVDLDIEGLEPGCFSIEPGPVLAAGAERDIHFRIHHRGSKPAAGRCQFAVRAAARRAYSGEEIVSIQAIHVAPVYDYKLQIIPPTGSTAASVTPVPMTIQEEPKAAPPQVLPPAPEKQATAWSEPAQVAQEPPARPAPAARIKTPLVETKPPFRLGISGLTLTPDICKAMGLPEGQTGVLVVGVVPGSPASQAGLRGGDQAMSVLGQELMLGGDVIIKVNDRPVSRIEEQAAILAAELGPASQPGKNLRIGVLRAGVPLELSISTGTPATEAPATEAIATPANEAGFHPGEALQPAPAEETSPVSTPQEGAAVPEAPAPEQPANQAIPAQPVEPVVKMTNKGKQPAQPGSQAKTRQSRPAARAANDQATTSRPSAAQETKKVTEAPKTPPQVAAEAEDSWWAPAAEEASQETMPAVIQIKARPAPTPGKAQAGATRSGEAGAPPQQQDWWADEEHEDEA